MVVFQKFNAQHSTQLILSINPYQTGLLWHLPCETIKPSRFPHFFATGEPHISGSVATVNPFYSRMISYVQFNNHFGRPQEISITNHLVIELSHIVHCTNCFTESGMHGAAKTTKRSPDGPAQASLPQSSSTQEEKLAMAQTLTEYDHRKGKWSDPIGDTRSRARQTAPQGNQRMRAALGIGKNILNYSVPQLFMPLLLLKAWFIKIKLNTCTVEMGTVKIVPTCTYLFSMYWWKLLIYWNKMLGSLGKQNVYFLFY